MSNSEGSFEDVRNIAETCEKLVEDVVHGRCTLEEFSEGLRNTGISSEAGGDYVREVKQRLESQLKNNGSGTASSSNTQQGPAPSGSPNPAQQQAAAENPGTGAGDMPSSATVNEEVAWALLRAKIEQLRFNSSDGSPQLEAPIAELLKALGPGSSPDSSVPASVLAIAPHLAKLSNANSLDEHLQKTWELRQAFSSEKAIDPIIDIMQCQPLQDPIPRSIWRKILRDEYVDFERLYGSTDRNYSHKDNREEFAGGFVLAKKEQIFSRKFIRTEVEWTRIFSAWEEGVLLLYPHRQQELQKYRRTIIDLFRATPYNTSVAIYFDIEARDRYARSPYHLDDKEQLQVPLLVQFFCGTASQHKRDSDSDSSNIPSKRSTVPCQNWSLGFCDDPCSNRRKHGVCSECGGQHRVKEFTECLEKLQERRRVSAGVSGKN